MTYLTMQQARAWLAERGVVASRQNVQGIAARIGKADPAAVTLRERVITERMVDSDALAEWLAQYPSKGGRPRKAD